MPWFKVDITDEQGVRCNDCIRANDEAEAKFTVEELGYVVNHIRKDRMKTIVEWFDRRIRPRKYNPETAFEHELERVRKLHPEFFDD